MLKKRFLNKKGVLYAPQTSFHKISRLSDILRNTYDSLVNVTMTYEEWLQSQGGLSECLWTKFLEIIEVSENLPTPNFDDENIKKMFSSSWWNFKRAFPNFVFATDKDEVEDCVMSMNPIATTDTKYLGTMEEVRAIYGSLPQKCIFLANNCTAPQQVELLQIVSKSYAFDDGQGYVASVKNHYWRIMVM